MKKVPYLIIATALLFTATDAGAKDHMKKNWLEHQNTEITEDFDEAVAKINNSSFSEEQKTILKAQAQANKELALTQAKDIDAQLQKNREARKAFWNNDNTKNDDKNAKKARKVFKEIDDILQ